MVEIHVDDGLGIALFRIKVSVMETEWSGNMDPETGIPV